VNANSHAIARAQTSILITATQMPASKRQLMTPLDRNYPIGKIVKLKMISLRNQVFSLFVGPSVAAPPSGLFRFLSNSSSLGGNPGPVCTDGVGKVSGLGNMLLSGPDLLKPHSGKKLDGDGRRASDTKRLGSAEMGVSILLLLLYAVPF